MPKHETIDEYIADCTEVVAPLMEALRTFINKTMTGATEGMSYGAPVFFNARKAPVIYLYGSKDHVNFGFLKSAKLSDPKGILQGSGRPSKHVKIYPDEPIDTAMLREFIDQCKTLKP
ncbi:MAG: DUF1801 domain-containing protein [Pseudomonadota bacterium]